MLRLVQLLRQGFKKIIIIIFLIKPFLSFSVFERVVHAFITMHLDYCNAVYAARHLCHASEGCCSTSYRLSPYPEYNLAAPKERSEF